MLGDTIESKKCRAIFGHQEKGWPLHKSAHLGRWEEGREECTWRQGRAKSHRSRCTSCSAWKQFPVICWSKTSRVSKAWDWWAPNRCNSWHPLQSKTPPRIVVGCTLTSFYFSQQEKGERRCQWRFKVNWKTSCHLIDFSLRSTWPKCQDFSPPASSTNIRRLSGFCSRPSLADL